MLLTPRWTICLGLCLTAFASYAQDNDGLGQVLQIQTRFHSFIGKPSWLLVIRDLDHGQNIPYVFDIERGHNTWIAFTHSRNYLITASTLQIETYKFRENRYRKYKINDFCSLQSFGRINRGISMSILISGHLSPNTNTFTCYVSKYRDTFNITDSG